MKSYALFSFIVLITIEASAKSFSRGQSFGHEADAYSVLPFERDSKISDWFEVVHKTIDFPFNTYFEGLRTPPHQDFSWGKFGHRLFFHWGFNSKPWSPQVEERVQECHWDVHTIALFKQKLINEQARRNRLVMENTSLTLHLGMSGQMREYTNGFASLLYDTHLLGDYSTTKKAPLQNLNYVIDDLKVSLFKKLKGGNEALRINKKLEATKSLYADPKIRAEKVLEILQNNVPKMILNAQNGYFRKHFEKNGIGMKVGL